MHHVIHDTDQRKYVVVEKESKKEVASFSYKDQSDYSIARGQASALRLRLDRKKVK